MAFASLTRIMTTFARSAARLPAWAAAIRIVSRPQIFSSPKCSAVRRLHASCRTSAPPILPPPILRHPSEADIQNALLRKAPLSSKDVEDLQQLPGLLSKLSSDRARVAKSVDETGVQIRALRSDPNQKQALEELQRTAADLRLQMRDIANAMQQLQAGIVGLRSKLPNDTHPKSPRGPEDNANVVKVWSPDLPHLLDVKETADHLSSTAGLNFPLPLSSFPATPAADMNRDHVKLCERLLHPHMSLLGGSALMPAQITSGPGFYHLLPPLSALSHAISTFALVLAGQHGFAQVGSPDVIRADVSDRCGFDPRDMPGTPDGEGGEVGGVPSQTYFVTAGSGSTVKDTSEQDLSQSSSDLVLAATGEIPLAGLLASRTISFQKSSTPIKLVSHTHAFRAEAGARGRATRGLYRLHQFDKVELFVACEGIQDGAAGDMQSNLVLEELRELQEEIMQKLQLPYRVLDMPTEELGASAYRKYDIEAWMPGRGTWGEVSSASNCTDFQSRRLHIRSTLQHSATGRGKGPSKSFVHTLNATAAAIPRLIIALMEVHGVKDNKLQLPDSLRPYWIADHEQVLWFSPRKNGSKRSVVASFTPAQHRALSTSSENRTIRSYTSTSTPPPPPPLPPRPLSTKSPSAFQRGVAALRALSVRTGTDPASLILSFAILHELTAFIPLILLFWIFTSLGVGERFLSWLGVGVGTVEVNTAAAQDDVREEEGVLGLARAKITQWTEEGIKRGRRFGERKGYFGMEKKEKGADPEGETAASDRFDLAGPFADAVAAYVLVKALMPVRVALSISLAPRFSRAVIEPVKRLYRRFRAREA